MSAPENAKPSIAVIDYLRGIAALGVAVFHVRVPLWIGWREIAAHPDRYSLADRMLAWLSAPAPFLGSLVMLFFVISGFCVHLPQVRAQGPFRFRPYFIRRFLRVYPPYLAAVVLTVLVIVAGHRQLGLPAASPTRITASLFMAQNYTPDQAGGALAEGGQLSANPALWSLPVEMELYLVYPLFLALLRRLGPSRAMGLVALVSAGATLASWAGLHQLNGNFAEYWIVWCLGAWLAEHWGRMSLRVPPRPWIWFAVAGLVLGAFGDARKFDPAILHLAYGGFYFWLVWILLARPALWTGLPSAVAQILAKLGIISYSLYLLHFPIFYLLGAAWTSWFGSKPANFLVPLLAGVAILPVVALFCRAVELPSHRLAKKAAARLRPDVLPPVPSRS